MEQVKQLSAQGVKEITLLGQNVNSYCYEETTNKQENNVQATNEQQQHDKQATNEQQQQQQQLSRGFSTLYKKKQMQQHATNFTQLLDKISLVDPEMRIRFTSPHPKDFPDGLLELIRDRKNVLLLKILPMLDLQIHSFTCPIW